MNFRRQLPARAALAAVTAVALAVTVTGCNSHSSSSKSKSKSRHSSSSSHKSSVSGSKHHGSSHKKRHSGHRSTQTCRYQDLDLSVNEVARAGGYLEIVADAKRACYLPGNPPGASFGTEHAASPAEKRNGHRIRIGPASEPVYAGLDPKTTRDNRAAGFDGFYFAMSDDDSRTLFLKVPGGVKEDRPVVTNWHTEREDVVPALGAR